MRPIRKWRGPYARRATTLLQVRKSDSVTSRFCDAQAVTNVLNQIAVNAEIPLSILTYSDGGIESSERESRCARARAPVIIRERWEPFESPMAAANRSEKNFSA
jgi:hypothetical protein